uniref:GIY-YIG homing endonuclease n=1 Tax=Myochromella boudieri TaxID=117066 RepID=A0A386TY33_9AGAR|nr:GIY-YIG homing endonuclease [Myochromella boudieri]AYE93136.1 GIY-YIG homing endonuclease [Myochromella boudieri]
MERFIFYFLLFFFVKKKRLKKHVDLIKTESTFQVDLVNTTQPLKLHKGGGSFNGLNLITFLSRPAEPQSQTDGYNQSVTRHGKYYSTENKAKNNALRTALPTVTRRVASLTCLKGGAKESTYSLSKANAKLDTERVREQAREDREASIIVNAHDNQREVVLKDFIKEKNLNPIYCYADLQLESTKKKIQTETKNLSGVYLILNKVTLDYYIGSAATNRFYARFYNHLFNFNGSGGSKIVKLAVRKYKLSNFYFLILEIFPDIVNKENNKKLLDLEDFYLKSLLPNYNILTEAGSSFGYKHTEISRIKMKYNYSIERREKIGNLNRGKSLSSETIAKLREKALKRITLNYPEESILNMKKKSKPIILYNKDYTVFGEYSSIIETANSIKCNEKTIRRALKTEKKLLKRQWFVKYK